MIEAAERNDVLPVCPHCRNEIREVFFRQVRGFLGKRYLYFCPHCRAVLGVSHRKGFWMG
ncbi:MAG TPA: hypothetical protein ENN17_13095 [bacterium]|nr:hypothetical protein [bacterium]